MTEPAALLADTRRALGLSLAGFAQRLRNRSGPKLTRQWLSRHEQGSPVPERLLRAIAETCAADEMLDMALRTRWRRLLSGPDPVITVPDRRRRLHELARRVPRNPRWPLYQQLAREHGATLDALLAEARDLLAMPPQDDWRPVAGDAITLVRQESTLGVALVRGELFVLVATLRNSGTVPWRQRLLTRLGPPVTSSLAFTPPVLPIPDTLPGQTCRIVIPGRGPWFPNQSLVTYAMTFPDLAPCLPGSLILMVDASTQDDVVSHPVPVDITTRFRDLRG
ncbi:transcriptional regulator with XRE-family HTH domain [Kibdelosporangium banguiense]|uniref:Transcriptional regulator with XRE-family HTH domain n=1 Tax=Kibdelosporangium banguiense TaxID=1365924 RepID=A0ABS4TZK6_9PSEU|nr:helix-turn-helix domain-containing protein [Kibdelosporangium banguiense]MBP2329351.1 transcriptional regulator with XRE-family HTH domain [Kibdelosporangium banguiense]